MASFADSWVSNFLRHCFTYLYTENFRKETYNIRNAHSTCTPPQTEIPRFTLIFSPDSTSNPIIKAKQDSPPSPDAAQVIYMGGKTRKKLNKSNSRGPRASASSSSGNRGLFVDGGFLSDWPAFNSPPSRGLSLSLYIFGLCPRVIFILFVLIVVLFREESE